MVRRADGILDIRQLDLIAATGVNAPLRRAHLNLALAQNTDKLRARLALIACAPAHRALETSLSTPRVCDSGL